MAIRKHLRCALFGSSYSKTPISKKWLLRPFTRTVHSDTGAYSGGIYLEVRTAPCYYQIPTRQGHHLRSVNSWNILAMALQTVDVPSATTVPSPTHAPPSHLEMDIP